jgi:fumarate reductase subunit D
VILFGLIALPLWKGAHHMRHTLIDFGGAERDALVAPLLYLLATAGSVLAVVAVVRI